MNLRIKYLKVPGCFGKSFPVVLNVGWDNVVTSEVNISSVLEECWHPSHVTTRRIQETELKLEFILKVWFIDRLTGLFPFQSVS